MSANVTNLMARLGCVGLGLVLMGQAEPTLAGTFSTSLTRVSLSASAPSAVLKLRNEGNAILRLQVSVFAWQQTASGEMQLAPTTDVVFFPALLTLGPGEERKIRIGTTAGFGSTEKPYRMFFDELPSHDPAPHGVRMRTRVSLPVFVGGASAAANVEIDDVRLHGATLTFRLRNLGAAHLPPGELEVSATNAAGRTVVTDRVKNWYVLPGGERLHEIVIPSDACLQIRRLAVAGRFASLTLEQTAEATSVACGADQAQSADPRGE